MDTVIKMNWTKAEIATLYDLPLMDLLYQAHCVHRANFDPNKIQTSTLISIKTGACPEDCAYCPQSARYKTDIKVQKLLSLEKVVQYAQRAKANGATRFCMGAAWRSPKDKDVTKVCELITAVKATGLQTCVTLGMLTIAQCKQLEETGLDYYSHNLDSSPDYYPAFITTRTYQDRLDTLANLRKTKIKVCCGGIIGLGEGREHRIGLLENLANQESHPESVPINLLARVAGTPLADAPDVDPIEFVRTIAIARILMPKAFVRLSAGRSTMSDELQALCFFAGANSIHHGEEKLLVTENPSIKQDQHLIEKLGMTIYENIHLAEQECSTTN